VLACGNLLLPGLDLRLARGRHGAHNGCGESFGDLAFLTGQSREFAAMVWVASPAGDDRGSIVFFLVALLDDGELGDLRGRFLVVSLWLDQKHCKVRCLMASVAPSRWKYPHDAMRLWACAAHLD
jgi:hypothetical protein